MTTSQGFDSAAIGKWSEPVEFPITRDRLREYAAATDDPIAPHVAGDYAPPVFASVPVYASASRALIEAIPGHLLLMALPTAQDFHFHAPLLPDTTVTTRAAVTRMQTRRGGVTVTVEAHTHDPDGRLLVKQYLSTMVRGTSIPETVGDGAPDHRLDASVRGRVPDAVAQQSFDWDQSRRYAQASGDPLPIYTDDELARALGLPGSIVHGLCALAFASVAIIRHACPEDPTRLKRLAVRFGEVIRPGDTITTRVWDVNNRAQMFETETGGRAVVMTDGLAEVVS
jgi:acyl dehydratase